MPKLVDESDRKDEIAGAAVRIFSQNGFRETSVREIADEAGMSKGNLYFYFDSKKEILSRVFLEFEERLHETIDECLARSDDPVDQLRILVDSIFDLFREMEPTIKVLFDFWSYSLHNPDQDFIDFEPFYSRIEDKLDSVLESGRKRDVFRSDFKDQLSSVLIGYIEGQLVQWQMNPASPSLKPVDEHGVGVMIEGLLKRNWP